MNRKPSATQSRKTVPWALTSDSLRHTYATFALINDGMDIHVLARNMGTSIPMIELHYNHLQPRMKKDMLSGPDYGLTREEYLAQKADGDAA